MTHLISIVIPVYNRHQLLPRVLWSIYSQSNQCLQIIIVDDGSSPPLNVATLPQSNYHPLKFIRQENQGAPAARNRGAVEATGEYIIFWDADIVAEPAMLSQMLAALQHNPRASYAYGDFYFGRKKMPAGPFDAARLREMNYIHTASLLRRQDFPGFDVTLKRFQDWDLWLALLETNKIGVYAPGFLFRILSHRKGISQWLPSFAFRAPWRWLPVLSRRVREYESAKELVLSKYKNKTP